jgi:hypothetical protein
VGANVKETVARNAGAAAENFLSRFLMGDRIKYGVIILGAVFLVPALWCGNVARGNEHDKSV